MEYYLGIDQGGTKSSVVVGAEDGTLIGCETGGGSVFYLDDPDNSSTQTVLRLSEKIFYGTGLSMDKITAVCAGLSGADWDFEYPLHERRLCEGLGAMNITTTVLNDCIIAMRAGSAAPNRAVICAGTEINIAAHAADGQEIIYGYYINPRLRGALALGGIVLDSVADAAIGVNPPTTLTDIVLNLTGYRSVESLLTDLATRRITIDPRDFVEGLLNAALEGDAVSVAIVDDFATGVSRYITAALPQLALTQADVELVYSGSVFKNVGSVITARITDALLPKFPHMRFINARYEPVCGALLTLLDRRYGANMPANVMAAFNRDCVKLGLIRD